MGPGSECVVYEGERMSRRGRGTGRYETERILRNCGAGIIGELLDRW